MRMTPAEIQAYITQINALPAATIKAMLENLTSAPPIAGSYKSINESVLGPDVLEDITKLAILQIAYADKYGATSENHFVAHELDRTIQYDGKELTAPGWYFSDTREIGGEAKKVISDFPFGSGWLLNLTDTRSTNSNDLQLAFDTKSGASAVRRKSSSGWGEFEPIGGIEENVTDNIDDDFVATDWIITDFTVNSGVNWYKINGSTGNSGVTSTLIPVVPGSKLYGTYFGSTPAQSCGGAYFGKGKRWVAPVCFPVGDVDASLVNAAIYETNNANVAPNQTLTFANLWELTVPDDAYYIALNLRMTATADTRHCQSISTLPMIGMTGAGNKVWHKGDAAKSVKKGKKLYIIGQSTVGIDRALRTIYDAASASTEQGGQQPIVGWQEYLIPYYRDVASLGFSGIGYPTVYGYIHNHEYDGYDDNPLSDADEVLILVGTNDMTVSTIGDWDSTDTSTFCGAVNAIIDEIYAINSGANATNKHPVTIYLCTYEAKRPEGDSGWAVVRMANEAARDIALHRDLVLIDCEREEGVNAANHPFLSYDSNTINTPYGMHLNNAGNKLRGEYFVKKLIGG